MKILFTADWHIKFGQKHVPAPFQLNRFRRMFTCLYELEKQVDVVIIGGDIFDKKPKLEELTLFLEYLAGTNKPHILFDGNHEASKKGQTFLHELENICKEISNTTIIKNPTEMYGIDFLPYTHLHNFDPADFKNEILCTHVRGEIKPHVRPEIDLQKLDRWTKVYAGDLHSTSNSQRNIMYPGSPLTTSFHRNLVDTGVFIVDTESITEEFIKLELPQLLRKTVENPEEIIKSDYHHTIYELTGNALELANLKVEDTGLLDKKIVTNSTDSILKFHKGMSIKDELRMFLSEIQELSDTEIDSIMGVYDDYD